MTTSTSTAGPVRVGFRTITPFIIHGKAPELVDFLKTTFGAEELKRNTAGEAYGFYSELRIGDTVIMIGGGTAARRGNLPSALHVYVEDCDAAYRRALDAGAVTLMGAHAEPSDRPYGERCSRMCIRRVRATTSISSSEPSTPKSSRRSNNRAG